MASMVQGNKKTTCIEKGSMTQCLNPPWPAIWETWLNGQSNDQQANKNFLLSVIGKSIVVM